METRKIIDLITFTLQVDKSSTHSIHCFYFL